MKEPRHPHREGLRQEILDAARELFVHEGYDSTSVRRIADKAGCASGTLYLYFNDKAAILRELCQETFARLNARMEGIVNDSGPPLEALRRAGRLYIEFGLQNPSHYLLTFTIGGRLVGEPGIHEVFTEAGLRCFGNLRALIERCIAAGFLRLTDVDEVSQCLWSSIHGLTSLLITKPGFPWVEQTRLVDTLLDLLLEGIRKK
jgi:AcrR family transcriptional regulator